SLRDCFLARVRANAAEYRGTRASRPWHVAAAYRGHGLEARATWDAMFLMVPLLFGLGTVAIPVIVHLLHRQRSTPIRRGAMHLLMESPLRQKRRRNIEHWLLMIARMAVLAVLVFALARPLLDSDLATPIGGGTSTDFAVVLDHSLSTGRAAGEGGKSVFGHG